MVATICRQFVSVPVLCASKPGVLETSWSAETISPGLVAVFPIFPAYAWFCQGRRFALAKRQLGHFGAGSQQCGAVKFRVWQLVGGGQKGCDQILCDIPSTCPLVFVRHWGSHEVGREWFRKMSFLVLFCEVQFHWVIYSVWNVEQ
jgi:hypothetical protein